MRHRLNCDVQQHMSTIDRNTVGGVWLYSQELDVLQSIIDHGWKPELNTGSKYGSAVYLGKNTRWYDYPNAIRCQLRLRTDHWIASFDTRAFGQGTSGKHLRAYLKERGICRRFEATKGDTAENQAIAQYFKEQEIDAIFFFETESQLVAVVYDYGVIESAEIIDATSIPLSPSLSVGSGLMK